MRLHDVCVIVIERAIVFSTMFAYFKFKMKKLLIARKGTHLYSNYRKLENISVVVEAFEMVQAV